jgi:GNAT superfamily N-acetyltransferase
MLQAAETAFVDRGCTSVLGPVNLTTHDEVGLLTEGFETPACLLSPYNPAFYASLLEEAGYIKSRDYHSYAWTAGVEPAPVLRRVVRRHERALAEGHWNFRGGTRDSWEHDRRVVFELYNECFRDLWGFVPISWPEYRERSDSFRAFYRPDLCIFAERDGKAEGFGLVLPDIHEVLRRIPEGRILPWGWWHLLFGVSRIRTGRVILLGVMPAARGAGIGAMIGWRLWESAKAAGLSGGEVSLIQDGNREVRRIVEAFRFPRCKTFRLYEKELVH